MRGLGAFLPPLALMGVIFFLSGQHNLDSDLGWIAAVGRKLVHFAEYALLCLLWWRPLRTRLAEQHAILAALLLSSAYAATDELHQSFVAGRHGSPVDWLIDTAGAATAALVLRRRVASPREATL